MKIPGDAHRAWYPLDTTALIFPPIISRRYTTVFRLSARLHEPVDLPALQEAVSQLYRRTPYFCVRLRRGFFWYYLEECSPAPVLPDDGAPCLDHPRHDTDRPLVLVRARGTRIAVEASHAITDGGGALTFLKTLLDHYRHVRAGVSPGEPRDTGGEPAGLLSPGPPEDWEERDANRMYHVSGRPHPPRYAPAWHLPGPLLPVGQYRVTTGRYRVQDLRERSRAMNVSLTDFFLAVFMFVLQERYFAAPPPSRRSRKPIRILVPVDMRLRTGNDTMRNFFVYAMVEIDQRLGRYELDEIARNVHHQLRAQLDTRSLQKQVSRSVAARLNRFNRLIPVFIKDLILKTLYRRRGDAVNTASFSNLGAVRLPDATARLVRDFDVLPPPSPVTGLNMTLISFEETVSVSFGSYRKTVEVERAFFRTLAQQGLRGELVVNWRE